MSLTGPCYRQHAALLARTCERLEIPFMDLTQALAQEEAHGNRLYWDYDGHMRGHADQMVGHLVFDR